MSNVFAFFEQRIRKLVKELDFAKDLELDLSRVNVEPPRDPAHGNLATNAAMVLAKAGQTESTCYCPQQLVEKLELEPNIT